MPKALTKRNQRFLATRAILSLDEIIKTQAKVAAANFDVKAFMNLIVKQMQKLTPATGVVVELVDKDDMVYRAASGTVAKHIGLRLPIGTSISGLCVKSHKVLYAKDTEKDPRVNLAACRKVKARSLVVAPLFHQGKAVGVLKIMSRVANGFNDIDVKNLQLMAGLVAAGLAHQIFHETTQQLLDERTKALLELKNAQRKLKHAAHYDALTNLPNRRLFNERLCYILEHLKRTQSLVALMYLDIDHFKSINDTLGHEMGDALLKSFAVRLKRCLRKYDMAARLGGDEFVVLLEDLRSSNDAKAIAKKVVQAMQQEFPLPNKLLKITTSIGVTLFRDDHLSNDAIIKQADKALYAAKLAGRNTYKFFQKNKKL